MDSTDMMMASLHDMGFGYNRALRALQATGFKGAEAAMEWLLARSDDPSLDEDFTEEEGQQMNEADSMDSTDMMMTSLIDMGFGYNRALRALQATGFKGAEPATEWLLTRLDDLSLDEEFTEEEGQQIKEALEKPKEEEKKLLTPEMMAETLAQMEELNVEKRAEREAREAEHARAIATGWSESCDNASTPKLRKQMVEDIKQKSRWKHLMTSPSVLKAMEVVPRHIFLKRNRYEAWNEEQCNESAYAYNKEMWCSRRQAPPAQNASMMSLAKLETAEKILVIGNEVGYTSSVVAQIVGINGLVKTVTEDQEALDWSKKLVEDSPFSRIIDWEQIADCRDKGDEPYILTDDYDEPYEVPTLLSVLKGKGTFNTIICDDIYYPSFPHHLRCLLEPSGGRIVAAVIVEEKHEGQLQYCVYSSTGQKEFKKTNNFNFNLNSETHDIKFE